ncbi:MAG: winged helix-turn-helix domain-containing protein [Oscillospiraceae bacterium]|jgi:two-component system alkaline phosphatase synthesis response regulator PhoP
MIYCVEDDDGIRELIVYTLQTAGFEVLGLSSGAALMEQLQRKLPQLLLLDIMLPGEDGLSLLKRLRSSPSTQALPVILVTAKGAEYDKVKGLDSGADDYITKPFGMMELISRVKALLRRAAPTCSPDRTVGNISLHVERHQVFAEGEEIFLTLKEFELLRYMMEHPGTVFTRDKLLELIWGYDFDGETRTVDVHIHMLRQKLGASGSAIETVRGVGYRLGDKK